MSEEMVCNYYKMSSSQWLKLKYDVKTLADLTDAEIVHGPFAQVIRYEAKPKEAALGSASYDFYKICLQDHSILHILEENPGLGLFPFCLYIVTHELVHIVRFCKFLQHFEATEKEKMMEEFRVHEATYGILQPANIEGMDAVLKFYEQWHRQHYAS
jgi:hypothetical protein